MKKLCNIKVKGQTYKVYKIDPNSEYFGRMNGTDKVIELTSTLKEKGILEDTTMHELTHAFFYECGQMKYCEDEELQETIGRFAKEIVKAYNTIINAYKK